MNYDVYIFTEGGSKIGLGHLTRCIALYDEIKTRGKEPLLIVNGEEMIERVLESRTFCIDNWYENWTKYIKREDGWKPDCIIDSYLADAKTYHEIQKSCNKALYIDDTNRINYPQGIIVNPSLYSNHLPYKKKEGQLYLTGIEYVILRRDFQSGYGRKARETLKEILIILGGSDVYNLTPIITEVFCMPEFVDLHTNIVIGEGFINVNQIEEISERSNNISLFYNLNAKKLYDLMKQCDFAITAAGQTIYELIAMRLPFACIKIIDNQMNNINGLIDQRIVDDYLDYYENPIISELQLYIINSIEKYTPVLARADQIAEMEKKEIGKGVRHIIDALVGENDSFTNYR